MKLQSPTLVLTLCGVLATALVTVTHAITAPEIAQQEKNQLIAIINQVLPSAQNDHTILDSCRLFSDPRLDLSNSAKPIYLAYEQQKLSAIIYNATANDGYNGDIKLVVAVSAQGEVLGVRVLSHNETPGLGDKIELRKSDWITHFNHKSLIPNQTASWAVSKDGGDFDAFTGATITPRAVVKAVKNVLMLHQAKLKAVVAATQTCEG